ATPDVYTLSLHDALPISLMRRMRKESFTLRTSTSAEEALRILAHSQIDLVVSDMHMAAMSGLQFLSIVAANHPKCIRIMLTGQRSEEHTSELQSRENLVC